MLNEWTDRMSAGQTAEFWQRRMDEEVARRIAEVEHDLRDTFARVGDVPSGFYDAMRHFLALRDRLFPGLPADPAWKILVTLAQTPESSAKTSMTGIAHGADVPMTTVLRYIAAMELQGIVERVPHPDDKRQVLIRLTDEGRRRLDTIAERWTARLLWLAAVPLILLCCARTVWAAY